MKYRIIEDGGMYYPQIKGWWGWNYVEHDTYSFLVCYKRLEEAISFVERIKANKNNTKVVWYSE